MAPAKAASKAGRDHEAGTSGFGRASSGKPPREGKVAVVEEVRDNLARHEGAILTDYRGLSVADLAELRSQLRQAGGLYKIYKNTLVRRALDGSVPAELEGVLEGPTAIAFVEEDAGSVAKVLNDFARQNPHLVLKGAVLPTGVLDAAGVMVLANLPPRSVLLAQLAGVLSAPLRQMAQLLQALPQNLAYGLGALLEARGGAPGEAGTAGGEQEDAALAASAAGEAAPETSVSKDPDTQQASEKEQEGS